MALARALAHVADPAALAPEDEGWGWFTESLFLAEGPGGVVLEIGWYPDSDPQGRFVVTLLAADPNGGLVWDPPRERRETRDVGEAVETAVGWAAWFAQSIPQEPQALFARLADHHPPWVAPTLTRLLPPARRAAMVAEVPSLAPYFTEDVG